VENTGETWLREVIKGKEVSGVEMMELVKMGTPALVLGMLLFLERINTKVNSIREHVQEIRNGITWQDTCDAKHDEINRRFVRIEQEIPAGKG
jgi:hypothetical protein